MVLLEQSPDEKPGSLEVEMLLLKSRETKLKRFGRKSRGYGKR